jgi:hypothetical protein
MRVKKKKKTSFKNTLSSFRARLLLTICIIRYYQVSIGLVFSIYDPTEVAIQKMIDASQRMLKVNSQGEDLGRMRSWVPLPPPGPFLSVVQLRYYFEFNLDNCRTNSAAIPISMDPTLTSSLSQMRPSFLESKSCLPRLT